MSRFTGPQGPGAMRSLRERKRAQADERNARTLPHKRRAYWRDLAEAGLAEPVADGVCLWPEKTAYQNKDAAMAALKGIARHNRKLQGLHPYPCPASHYHLGRLLRRATVAWKAAA